MKNLDEYQNSLFKTSEKSNSKNQLLRFCLGIVLIGVGIFLMLQMTTVQTSWYIWHIGSFGVPSGAIVIPLLIGITMLFFNYKSIIAWLVLAASLIFIVLTIIMSVRITFNNTSLLVFIIIFGAIFAGIGLVLSTIFK